LHKDECPYISATMLAEALNLNDVQVRKDLSQISSGGKPKIGYNKANLILDLENYLGYNKTDSAIIVGVGNLGKALLAYSGFAEYGLEIVAAFDTDESLIGTNINGKQVFSLDKLPHICERLNVKIGIITVPALYAQSICDSLTACGICAIWNFAPAHLTVPPNVLVQNENMAASLAILIKHLSSKINSEDS
jgi:redox-sensing transcriptional repressor